MSADPYVTEPGNTQNYNRYSYVYNNPPSAVDPSGFGIFRFTWRHDDENEHSCYGSGSACADYQREQADRERQRTQQAVDESRREGTQIVITFRGGEYVNTPQGDHDYRADNLVCKRPLTEGQVKELIGRFTAPNEFNLLLGRTQGEGTHLVATYGIPGGWVTTTFYNNGTIGRNTTTPFHVFTGTVDRWIDNTPDGAYMRTHGTGGYGVSDLQPGVNMSNMIAGLGPSVSVDWGRVLDNTNQAMGPAVFNHVDSYVKDYVKDHFSGCL